MSARTPAAEQLIKCVDGPAAAIMDYIIVDFPTVIGFLVFRSGLELCIIWLASRLWLSLQPPAHAIQCSHRNNIPNIPYLQWLYYFAAAVMVRQQFALILFKKQIENSIES